MHFYSGPPLHFLSGVDNLFCLDRNSVYDTLYSSSKFYKEVIVVMKLNFHLRRSIRRIILRNIHIHCGSDKPQAT